VHVYIYIHTHTLTHTHTSQYSWYWPLIPIENCQCVRLIMFYCLLSSVIQYQHVMKNLDIIAFEGIM